MALVVAAVVAAPEAAFAACSSFVGGAGTGQARSAWSNAANWSTGAVPNASTDVCLDNLATRTPNVDIAADVRSLTATSAFTRNLTFEADVTLRVRGDLSWAGTGTLDSGTNAGDITVDGDVNLSNGGWMQNGGTTVTVAGDLSITGGSFTASSGPLQIGRDLTVTGSGTFNGSSGLIKIARNLGPLSGTSFRASSTMIRVGGAFNHTAGAYNDNNGNILFNATTSQTHTFGGAVFKRATFNDGMVGYWNFDDAAFSGSRPSDTSGYGNNASSSNNVGRGTSSPPPLAFADASYGVFNGSSSRVTLTVSQLPASNAAQTIAAWVNIDALPSQASSLVSLTGATNAVKLGLSSTSLRVLRNDGTALVSTTAPSTDVWHHVAYTWDGTSNRLYVDGAAVTPTTTAHDAGAVTAAFLGATSASAGFFDGGLDEVRIYDRALTAQEVNSLALGRMPGTSIATHTLSDPYLATVGSNVADFVIASGTVTGAAAITIEGSWLNYGGRFTGTGTVRMTSTGGESILSGGSVFAALSIGGSNGGAPYNLQDRLWIPNGPFTLSTGRFASNGHTMHVGTLALSAGATLNVSGGTIVLDSASDVTLPSAVLTSYYDLRLEDATEANLVGYWKLDEGTGTGGSTTRDWSGNGNAGTLSATGANWTLASDALKFDNAAALAFDGAAGYISTGISAMPAADAAQTISAWVNIAALPAAASSMVSLNGASSAVRLGLSSTSLRVLRHDGATLVSTVAPSTGTWHHVAYSWDGVNNRLFVDGALAASTTTSHDSGAVTSAFIGATTASTDFFNGKIDDVRVYDAALSIRQVLSLADGCYPGRGGYATFSLAANTTVTNTFVINAGNLSTGSYTFTASLATAPAFVGAGSLVVGSAAQTFSGGLAVRPGGTLQMGTSGGSVQIANGKSLLVDGGLVASTSGATIQNAGTGSYAFLVGTTASATPTLRITGLTVKHTDSNGMWINADPGAVTTFTRFDNIAFASGNGAHHLQIYAKGLFLTSNGLTFDAGTNATTTYNIKLSGNGHTGTPDTSRTHAMFGGATCANNVASCQAWKSDDDANNDGIPGNPASNGAVVQFVRGAQTDTAGTVVGLPAAAFDWNTGAYYGTYVAYNQASGNNSAVYVRDGAGAPMYAWTSPAAEDIVGTPRFTTSGGKHYLYVAMASGKVYQLLDDGTQLTTTGASWPSNPFDCGCTIVTPLALDANNLYWGGIQGGNKLWTLGQVTASQPMGSPFPLPQALTTASPAVWTSGPTTYAFVGSVGHLLQINVTNQSLAADNANPGSASVFGRIALGTRNGNKIFAGDDAGYLWAIDPANFAGTNKLWSYNVPGDSIKSSPYYHYATNTVQFGTEAGKVVVLSSAGTPMAGYPFTVGSSTDQIRAGILYWSGILVVGTQNGRLTFIDRNNGTTGPAIIVEYEFGSNQVVSGIGYDANTNRYMVSVADPSLLDGRVYFFDAIPDPTPGAL